MAKKTETKMTKKEIIDKIMESLNILAVPVAGVVAVWSTIDTTAYVLSGFELVNSTLEYVKKFIKD